MLFYKVRQKRKGKRKIYKKKKKRKGADGFGVVVVAFMGVFWW